MQGRWMIAAGVVVVGMLLLAQALTPAAGQSMEWEQTGRWQVVRVDPTGAARAELPADALVAPPILVDTVTGQTWMLQPINATRLPFRWMKLERE